MAEKRYRLLQLTTLVGTLAVWEAAVRLNGDLRTYPCPSEVVMAAVRTLGDGSLIAATTGSLGRVLIGFAIGGVLGVPLGMLMGWLAPVGRALGPIVDALRSIAPIAWIPMAILWLGIRGDAALFIVAYAAFFPFVLNTIQGVRLLDRRLVDASRALGARGSLILVSVVLPSALPLILTGARIAMAFAWASIIAAELAMGIKVGEHGQAAVGLGQLMVDTLYIRRDIDGLVLYMAMIGAISLCIDQGMRRLQSALTPWQMA